MSDFKFEDANATGSKPKKKTKYPARSTAAKTKMLTVCKKCGNGNGNGYQYCTACHKAHKARNGKALTTQAVQVPPIDPDEVLKLVALEACDPQDDVEERQAA